MLSRTVETIERLLDYEKQHEVKEEDKATSAYEQMIENDAVEVLNDFLLKSSAFDLDDTNLEQEAGGSFLERINVIVADL